MSIVSDFILRLLNKMNVLAVTRTLFFPNLLLNILIGSSRGHFYGRKI